MLNGEHLTHEFEPLANDTQRRRNGRRKVDVPVEQYRWWLRQHNSKTEYPSPYRQPDEEDCAPMFDWQEASYPACNDMHQWDLYDQLSSGNETEVLGQGTWRVTFRVTEFDGTGLAYKMLRATDGKYGEGKFSARNYEIHRRDAVIYEKLSPSSQHVLHMFGHCGLSGVFELADGGVLKDKLWYEDEDKLRHDASWSMLDRLRIATHIAIGLKEIHEAGGGEYPAFSACDLQIDQILLVGKRWKVSDFNRGEFIRWNYVTERPCTYYQYYNPMNDLSRSPEEFEFFGGKAELTAAVDVYHLGTMLYTIMTSINPYDDLILWGDMLGEDYYALKNSVVHSRIMRGRMPRVPQYLLARKDRETVTIIRAIKMCLRFDPNDRATATEVADYLVDQLAKIVESNIADIAGVINAPPRIVFYATGGAAHRLIDPWPLVRYLDVPKKGQNDDFAQQSFTESTMPSHVMMAGRNSILYLQWASNSFAMSFE